jgi:hypothetical protein
VRVRGGWLYRYLLLLLLLILSVGFQRVGDARNSSGPYGVLYSLIQHSCTFFRFSLHNLKSRLVFSVLSTHQHYFFSERAVTDTGYPTVHHNAAPLCPHIADDELRPEPLLLVRYEVSFRKHRGVAHCDAIYLFICDYTGYEPRAAHAMM